jgi:hypothetical protein
MRQLRRCYILQAPNCVYHHDTSRLAIYGGQPTVTFSALPVTCRNASEKCLLETPRQGLMPGAGAIRSQRCVTEQCFHLTDGLHFIWRNGVPAIHVTPFVM